MTVLMTRARQTLLLRYNPSTQFHKELLILASSAVDLASAPRFSAIVSKPDCRSQRLVVNDYESMCPAKAMQGPELENIAHNMAQNRPQA